MPWTPSDAEKHTKAANTPSKRELWAKIANETLQRTGNEARAIREANAVIARHTWYRPKHKWLTVAAALVWSVLLIHPAAAQTHPAPNSGGGQPGNPTINVAPTPPFTAPANQWTTGLSQSGWSFGNTITPTGGNTASPLPNILGRTINVLDYGAKCDGVTDDTAAIQTALNAAGSKGGATVVLPAATCAVAGTLTMSASNVHLVGQGMGATTLLFTGTGTADGIDLGTGANPTNCTGTSPPSNCQQVINLSVESMKIQAPNRTGGILFNINGVRQGIFHDLDCLGWDIIMTQYINNIIFSHVFATGNDPTNFVVSLAQTITSGTSAGWYRSDVVVFSDFTLGVQGKGGSCINWDGMLNTVRMMRTTLLLCSTGLAISNTQQSSSYYPSFLFTDDLEIDGASKYGILINAGSDMNIENSYVDTFAATGAGAYPLYIKPDYTASVTRGILLVGDSFNDSKDQIAVINAQDVTISGSQFFDSNKASTNTYPTIEIGANSVGVTVTGTFVGTRYGDPDAPNYGIQVDAGAKNISLVGNNYQGAATANVYNGTSSAISYIGGTDRNGNAITATTCAASSAC